MCLDVARGDRDGERVKLIHAADLHIDSPMRGLVPYEGAPVDVLRRATRAAFTNLVDFALREQAELLLVAGDVFDGPWRDYSTGLFFTTELARLREAGTQVTLVRGNHDAENRMFRHQLRYPDNVRELAADAPETVRYEKLGVAVHGQSFPTRDVTDDLAARYPAPERGVFNVGLLHTSCDGRPGHANYAPTRVETLVSRGYEYWALGHVHAREVLHEKPWIVFPGNLQARHVREPGEKGVSLVRASGTRVLSVEHVPLDVLRFTELFVDSEADKLVDAIDEAVVRLEGPVTAADGRTLAVRVHVRGSRELVARVLAGHERAVTELRRAAHERFGEQVYVERLEASPREDSAARVATAAELSVLDGLVLTADIAAECEKALEALKKKLPTRLVEGPDALDLSGPDALARLLDEGRALARAQLEGEGGP